MNIIDTPLQFDPRKRIWYNPFFSVDIPLPDRCPHCRAVGSHALVSIAENPELTNQYEALYFCNGCNDFFRASYFHSGYTVITANDIIPLFLKKIHGSIHEETFSQALSSLSPQFVKIFHEAEIAEQSRLLAIAGPGYRKALEQLVKDFAIHTHPEDGENIYKIQLGQVINKYVNHPKIQALSKGASWLGNDQTHTAKKHKSYTLDDLKRFIIAVAKYIDLELTVEEAQALLESPK